MFSDMRRARRPVRGKLGASLAGAAVCLLFGWFYLSSGGDDEGAPAASHLEWEKGEDGAVLRDARGNLDRKNRKKKKRKSGDGSGFSGLESGKKTKTKKAHKVVEF